METERKNAMIPDEKYMNNVLNTPVSRRRLLRRSIQTGVTLIAGDALFRLSEQGSRFNSFSSSINQFFERIGPQPADNYYLFQPEDIPYTGEVPVSMENLKKIIQRVHGADLYVRHLIDDKETQMDALDLAQIHDFSYPYFLGVYHQNKKVFLAESTDLEFWKQKQVLVENAFNADLYEDNGEFFLAYEQPTYMNGMYRLGTNIGLNHYRSRKNLLKGKPDGINSLPKSNIPITTNQGTPNIESVETNGRYKKIKMRCHMGKEVLVGSIFPPVRDIQGYLEVEFDSKKPNNARVLRGTEDVLLNNILQNELGAWKSGVRDAIEYEGDIYLICEINKTPGTDGNDFDTWSIVYGTNGHYENLYIITDENTLSTGVPKASKILYGNKDAFVFTMFSYKTVYKWNKVGPFLYANYL